MRKEDFPIFKSNPRLVYLDSGATSQMPETTINAISDYYSNYKANVHRGIYQISEKATDKYEEARRIVANFINAEEDEIVFTGGLTDGMNSLASSLGYNLKPEDEILTTIQEHHSSFLPFQRLAKDRELKLNYVELTDDLELDMNDLENKLTNKTKYFIVSGLSNVTGYVAPLKEITKICHKNGTKVIVDAAQLAPHIQIDVKELDVDYLLIAGHKLYGPTGIGVLYGKKELLDDLTPLKVGGGMIEIVQRDKSTWTTGPEKHEAGTPNIAGAIGLAESVRFLEEIGMDTIEQYEKELTEYAKRELNKIDGIKLITPSNPEVRTSVISIHLESAHPHDIADILDRHKIAVRAGHHCAQILIKEHLMLPATARISIGLYNEKSDIDRLVEALNEVNKIFK